MIGRADIEGSKSYVAKSAWQPQASYPCGNFSDTFICTVRICTAPVKLPTWLCLHRNGRNIRNKFLKNSNNIRMPFSQRIKA
ncbi:hypothetical protein PFUGPA_02659 [Plasmodium falciparum Palo Alto/Uganda]|uniref:Senescence-associated protein n=1 Tax=Plasmodium falciparum (isolate Palo Alto / Uganda) TaxID=57270 RepID=W4IZV8_PLAFP|nr:hypothetical protein PFUGPA_02659 [Plasmodium falciparum Palo Alto/Uganda]